jgi:L-iditol 2-dehydrogenase
VITGIHSDALVPFETSHMRRKELTIFNVRRSNHEEHGALALMLEHPDWFAPVVTHTRPLESIDRAFRMAENYEDGVGKLVIQPSSR